MAWRNLKRIWLERGLAETILGIFHGAFTILYSSYEIQCQRAAAPFHAKRKKSTGLK